MKSTSQPRIRKYKPKVRIVYVDPHGGLKTYRFQYRVPNFSGDPKKKWYRPTRVKTVTMKFVSSVSAQEWMDLKSRELALKYGGIDLISQYPEVR